jgi:hypothetical protein
MRWREGWDAGWVDPVADRLIGSAIRLLRRWSRERFPEASVAPGYVLRLRVRRDGRLGSFVILRDGRVAPPRFWGEHRVFFYFCRPFHEWSRLAAVLREPQGDLPEFWRVDAELGLLIKDEDGGCITLPLPVVAALLRRCLDTPDLTVAEGVGL